MLFSSSCSNVFDARAVVVGVGCVCGVYLLCGGRSSVLGIIALSGGIAGPQGKVVTQQLHDQRAVLVGVLVQGIQLGNCVVKSLLINNLI